MTMNEGPRDSRQDRGIALILVLLAILVLTSLAAAMVFSARADTFSSYNYRIGTQADFVARAGVQKALNFFESSSYVPISPLADAPGASTYNVTNVYQLPIGLIGANSTSPYVSMPINLYYTQYGPVKCLSGISGCSGQAVTLGDTSSDSEYPSATYTNSVDVATNWYNYINNPTTGSPKANEISDGLGGTGTYTVTAQLLNYHSVNNAQYGVAAANCPSASNDPWTDPAASDGICRQPFEVWQVTSKGTWNSNVGAGAEEPTVQVVATISPMYMPYSGNAFYGLCSVTMTGNVCTDGYNSSSGQYGASSWEGNGACVSPSTGTTNAQASGAGIGSNGGVSISGSSYQVGGNVTYADSNTSSSCNTGFSGSSSGVTGSVLPGPAIPTPTLPTMTPLYNPPTASPAPSTAAAPPVYPLKKDDTVNVYLNKDPTALNNTLTAAGFTSGLCPTTSGDTAFVVDYSYSVNKQTGVGSYGGTCTAVPGSGTSGSPYDLGDISVGTSASNAGTINIISPTGSLSSPTVADVNSITVTNNGTINTTSTDSGLYNLTTGVPTVTLPTSNSTASPLIMNVAGSMNMTGGSVDLNFNPADPGVPSPGFLTINVEGTSVSLQGQAQLSAVVIAPNAAVTLGGSGSSGALFGSLLGNTITDKGGYPVHYDESLSTEAGKLWTLQVVSVTRQMY